MMKHKQKISIVTVDTGNFNVKSLNHRNIIDAFITKTDEVQTVTPKMAHIKYSKVGNETSTSDNNNK